MLASIKCRSGCLARLQLTNIRGRRGACCSSGCCLTDLNVLLAAPASSLAVSEIMARLDRIARDSENPLGKVWFIKRWQMDVAHAADTPEAHGSMPTIQEAEERSCGPSPASATPVAITPQRSSLPKLQIQKQAPAKVVVARAAQHRVQSDWPDSSSSGSTVEDSPVETPMSRTTLPPLINPFGRAQPAFCDDSSLFFSDSARQHVDATADCSEPSTIHNPGSSKCAGGRTRSSYPGLVSPALPIPIPIPQRQTVTDRRLH